MKIEADLSKTIEYKGENCFLFSLDNVILGYFPLS